MEYRQSPSELLRTADVARMIPRLAGGTSLDVGARDGHFSKLLAEQFDAVTALDLKAPNLSHPRVQCVSGDVRALDFHDDAFDLVVCTEVLEHVVPASLQAACAELARVCRHYLLIGVPFKQDIRVGRTTCIHCRAVNPPWGHVNAFDEARLRTLFAPLNLEKLSFVGSHGGTTNKLACRLLDWAGNPYGTYDQDEACLACGAPQRKAPPRNLLQKVATKAAHWARRATEPAQATDPFWIHCLFRKPASHGAAQRSAHGVPRQAHAQPAARANMPSVTA